MKFLLQISNSISTAEKSLAVILLGLMILLSFLQVVLRNVFSTGILWVDPLLRNFVLWIAFLGASLATHNEKNINVDIFSRFLPERRRHFVKTVIYVFAAVVSFFLLKASLTFLFDEYASETILFTIGEVNIFSWWMQLIVPIGFGMMLFRFFLFALQYFIKAVFPQTTKVVS
ncbi:MAG: TRAP transporter small permease [Bacteroidota bacterium]|nr:TRAP transporter small permease [Bacteroidota bacterium]